MEGQPNRRQSLLLTSITLVFFLTRPSHARPSVSGNDTISDDLPASVIVCTPTYWYDVVWFYFANYLLHALSVRSLPGENLFSSIVFKLSCLLIPYTGLRRGLCLIARAANLTHDDLQAAARANALCMVVRAADWKPEDGEVTHGCRFEKTEGSSRSSRSENVKKEAHQKELPLTSVNIEEAATSSTTSTRGDTPGALTFNITNSYTPPPAFGVLDRIYRIFVQTHRFANHTPSKGLRLDPDCVKVHGFCKLSPGYALSYVPEDMKVCPRYVNEGHPNVRSAIRTRNLAALMTALWSDTKVATSHSAPRILFSLMQTISGGFSLYRAQGSQIERYGFAAFGLTVLPYMIVSVFNFIGSLLTNEYEMMYMVHSSIMEEMIKRGGAVDGVVGTLADCEEPESAAASSQERVLPEGASLQFQLDGDSIRYRDLSQTSAYSDALALTPLSTPKRSVTDIVIRERRWWKRFCHWYRVKRKGLIKPEVPPGTTVIFIPAHHSFTRVPMPSYEPFIRVLTVALLIGAVAVPYITIYLLSGFRKAQSTNSQRTFVLNWLICGQLMGYAVGSVEKLSGRRELLKGFLIIFVSYGSYCLSGFVTVAQQMLEMGKCTAV